MYNRDGRGNPGRNASKHTVKLLLSDVLRRRKTTLRTFTDSFGLTTYAGLDIMCARMGVVTPTKEEFDVARPPTEQVNNPQEGVVVLEAPPVIDEITGNKIDPEGPVVSDVIVVTDQRDPRGALVRLEQPTEDPRKKKIKKV